jgi:hypothetical protein
MGIRMVIREVYIQWNKEQLVKLNQSYHEITSKFTNRVNQTIELINNISQEIFNINIAQKIDTVELSDKEYFYFKFGNTSTPLLMPNLSDFLFILPKSVGNRMVLSKYMDRVEEELERNGNNLK